MGCILVLFSFLVIRSSLVDSFPYPEGNIDGAKTHDLPSDPRYFQPQPNVYQNTQNPIFEWNRHNGLDNQQIDRNNFEGPANDYSYRQQISSYNNVIPAAMLQNGYYPQGPNIILAQQPASDSDSANEEWWNNQRLYLQQQNQLYEKPYEVNSFTQNYARPYVNQGSYGQGYSPFQSAGLIAPKPVDSLISYGQSWLPQNQYNYLTTANPIDYLSWPVFEDQNAQLVKSNIPGEYSIPVSEKNPSQDLVLIPEPVQSDGQERIVASQQPVYNPTIIPKHYIIIHLNGTYEHIDNLDSITVDEFKVVHFKSIPVYALIEVEEEINTEKQTSLEVPNATEITEILRDTNLNKNDHSYPGTHQSYKYPFTQVTTEETAYDMSYFRPEFIMPIQSTTENTIDSIKNSLLQTKTTTGNIETDENSLITQPTIDNTFISTTDNTIDTATDSTIDKATASTTDSTTNSTTDTNFDSDTGYTNNIVDLFTETSQYSTPNPNDKTQNNLFTTQTAEIPQQAQNFNNYYNYEDIDYNADTRYNTPNTKSYTSQQTTRTNNDIKENNYNDFDTMLSSNLPERTLNKTEKYTEKDTSSINQKPSQLRDDLKIDVSELKTVVDKPVVWFRPDENFWDKVTKGEQAYDALTIYDVHCKPKLIEKVTTIHHHANGTEVVENVETIWDSPDDVNPREIRSKVEFREPL